MIYLLDTNVCAQYLNGRSLLVRDHLNATLPHDVAVCSIVKAELLYGAAKSSRSAKTRATQEAFLSRFVSLPFEDRAAEIYGTIRAGVEKLGKPVGLNDLLIAAIALANNLTLVTHNTGEFSRIVSLQLEDWEI